MAAFVVALYRSAEDEAHLALFPAEQVDAAEDWLVQLAQSEGLHVADINALRELESRAPVAIDIFEGQPGGRMQPH